MPSGAWSQNHWLQAVGLGPPTSPAAPTWQCPGLERAAGSSLACLPLPLPCPAKGFGERRTEKRCARGRRPSSGRLTSPRLGCGFGAVRGEPARRCPVPGTRRSATRQRQDGLGTGRPRGSVHSRRDRRGRCAPRAAGAPAARWLLLPPPTSPPPGGARGRGSAGSSGPAAVRRAGGVLTGGGSLRPRVG